jgi:hypothetical protein
MRKEWGKFLNVSKEGAHFRIGKEGFLRGKIVSHKKCLDFLKGK